MAASLIPKCCRSFFDSILTNIVWRLHMKSRNAIIRLTLPCLLLVAVLVFAKDNGKPVTVKGYVLDSACAFTKGLSKPISKNCAEACAKAGSPLVILADDGTI